MRGLSCSACLDALCLSSIIFARLRCMYDLRAQFMFFFHFCPHVMLLVAVVIALFYHGQQIKRRISVPCQRCVKMTFIATGEEC